MKLPRRKWLYLAAGTGAISLLGGKLFYWDKLNLIQNYPEVLGNQVKLKKNGKKVLIIGAGPSGLMTGLDLLDRGFEVVILEKSSMPGGRLSSWKDSHFADFTKDNPFPIEHSTHGIWNFYNNLREFMGRHGLQIRNKSANAPHSPFTVAHPDGSLFDLKQGTKWPSIFYAFNEANNYSKNTRAFDSKQLLSLISFDPGNLDETQYLDSITMHDWCIRNNIPQQTIDDFVDPLLKMSNFNDAKNSSALAWHRHTISHFGHWKDLANIQFYSQNTQDSFIQPLVDKILRRGGEIIYQRQVDQIQIKNKRITAVKTKQFQAGEYICPHCGEVHTYSTNKCDRCGWVGDDFFPARQITEEYHADYYLAGIDIPSMQELIESTPLKNLDDFQKFQNLKATNVVVLYLYYPRNNNTSIWEKVFQEREVVFTSSFKTIGTLIYLNQLKIDQLGDTPGDIIEVQLQESANVFHLTESDIIDLVETDLELIFKNKPELEDYRVLKWNNFSGLKPQSEKNQLKHETPLENFYLLGDHIKVSQNSNFMERVAVVSKTVINQILAAEKISGGNLEILPSETPDPLLSLIRQTLKV